MGQWWCAGARQRAQEIDNIEEILPHLSPDSDVLNEAVKVQGEAKESIMLGHATDLESKVHAGIAKRAFAKTTYFGDLCKAYKKAPFAKDFPLDKTVHPAVLKIIKHVETPAGAAGSDASQVSAKSKAKAEGPTKKRKTT